MKIRMLIALLMSYAGNVWAAAGGEPEGSSLVVKIFLGFFALIVATQLIPGLIMLASLLKGLFSKSSDSTVDKGLRS